MEKKVSLILPCYNVERYLPNFIKSIVEQTYSNIELIIVNDGSTDRTESIIKENEVTLRNRFDFKYLYQVNQGLGSAINAGLKVFTGDYLCWADPDDYLESQSIEKRVNYLTMHPEIGLVTTDASIRKGNVDGEITGYISDFFPEDNENPDQFILLLNAKSILCSGCHMTTRTVFLDVNPNRDIYPARRGQNWQMLLPICYKYKRAFLKEPLYRYVIYASSMSQGDDSEDKVIKRLTEHRNIVYNTLDRIDMGDKERKHYKQIFEKNIKKDLFECSIKYGNIKSALKYFFCLFGQKNNKRVMIIDILCLIRKKCFKNGKPSGNC